MPAGDAPGAGFLPDGEGAHMSRQVLLAVGNGMMGDDGAGALLVKMMMQEPLEGWEALNGGSAPENVLHRVRELSPQQVLVVDAADMDLPPGSVRRIQDELLENPFFMTTHTLPLTFVIEALRDFVPTVDLLGIQPGTVAFGYPMSASVKQAVMEVYNRLKEGNTDWETLEPFVVE
jgi:hydrogenase 3 maturation protease